MSDLSQDLAELVVAGRSASRPTRADFERVLGGVRGRMGAVAASGKLTAAASTGQGVRWLSGKTMAITAAGVSLLMSGVAFWGFNTPEPRRAESVAEPQRGSPALPALPVMRVIVSNGTAPDAARLPRPSGPASSQPKTPAAREPLRNRDSLAEEVAILSRAETELHSGRAESALRALGEHERKFPSGILAEERISARVQALCALGRNTEANAQLTRLRPASLHSESARRACAASSGARQTTSATGQPSASSSANKQ